MYVFLDTNIILEGKPLHKLPWDEVAKEGPIVVAFTPSVLDEIDAKKRDGRLGEVAREFNRLMRPATSGELIPLAGARDGISIQLVRCSKLDWDKFGDLDPADADSRILAEVLSAKEIPDDEKYLVSNDLKPIRLAHQYHLKAVHVSEAWLREREPSKHEKELQRLRQRVADLEKTEPNLSCEIRTKGPRPRNFRVEALTEAERHQLVSGIFKRNPKPLPREHSGLAMLSRQWNDEYVSDDDYAEFVSASVPRFADRFAALLEESLGQVPLEIAIRNNGPVRAENLVVKISVSSGWMNLRPIYYPLRGPTPRVTRSQLYEPTFPTGFHGRPGRHDVDVAIEPERDPECELHCQDFHAEREWTLRGVLFLDPRAHGTVDLEVRITAANLHGLVKVKSQTDREIVDVRASELVDLESGQLLVRTAVLDQINDLLGGDEPRVGEVQFFPLDDD